MTSFHPLYVIGKTIKEAKEYFDQHQIKYNLQTSSKAYNFGGALSIHTTYEIGKNIMIIKSKTPKRMVL